MVKPPFPTVISDSMMSAYRGCPRKFELNYLHNWQGKNGNIHFHAGKCYATGLETARRHFYAGGTAGDAEKLGAEALEREYGDFICPPDSAKSKERTLGAYRFYLQQYPLETEEAVPVKLADGTLGVEFAFLEPLDFKHPESGEPLQYSGRFDMLCNYNGAILGEDDKTSSQLGATWPKQWDLRSQFTGYAWGAARLGMPLAGFLIRGVSILKADKLGKGRYETMETITYRPQWMIDRWYEGLMKDLASMQRDWETGKFNYNLDDACNAFGGCAYKQICLSKDPEPWLQASFKQIAWDPVTRETKVLSP